MAFTCMRVISAIFMLAFLLAVYIVSFEVDFWSWDTYTYTSLTNTFADAAPLHGTRASELADLGSDIPLRVDGEEQYKQQLRNEENHQQHHQTEPKVTVEMPEDTTATLSNPQKEHNEIIAYSNSSENESSDGFPTEGPTPEADSESDPVLKENYKHEETKIIKKQTVEKEDITSNLSKQPHPATQQQHISSKRKTRARTFLIVFMGHSGSTAFTTELRTHKDFEIEILEPLEHGEYEFDTDKALVRARMLMDHGIELGKIPGFKIRPFHVSNKPELWREFAKEYDTRIIWQYRENVLKQAVGEYRNKFLNDSSVIEGLRTDVEPCQEGSGQICRFKIENFRGLHALLNKFSINDELLTQAVRTFRRDNEVHIVRYEDYLYNRERTMRDAFDFLGVDYQGTESQRRKASPDNLCDMVSNFQELCDHFLQCQLWRPHLADEKNGCRCESGKWQSFDSTFCRREAWYQDVNNNK